MVEMLGVGLPRVARPVWRPKPVQPLSYASAALAAGVVVRLRAVRREFDVTEAGELLLSAPIGGPTLVSWQRHGRPAVALGAPYRMDRAELRVSNRARWQGLTTGVRLVCRDWSPVFLIADGDLEVLALAAAVSQRQAEQVEQTQ